MAQKAGETEEDAAVELLADHYDSWEDCFVDIRGGGEQLDLKKEYRLSVGKGMSGLQGKYSGWVLECGGRRRPDYRYRECVKGSKILSSEERELL